jgi:dTDP-4-dehydrorhamnose reductase
MTRLLLTGAAGMLGRDVAAQAAARGVPVTAAARGDLDITDPDAVRSAVGPGDVIVNCAAWTAVDDAESHEAEAFAVNGIGAANLARAAREQGAWLVHVSTDYVFDGGLPGVQQVPYPEDAPAAPRSAYGRTKAAGEWAVRAELPDRHWILRTAWLYGAHGPSFVRTMARLERTRDTVEVVVDQHGQPTWSRDLAERIICLVTTRSGDGGLRAPAGTYHATAAGSTTWFTLARAVFTLLGADPERVRPTTSEAFARPARRPSWSVLGHDRWAEAGLGPMRPWDVALREALADGAVLGTPASR